MFAGSCQATIRRISGPNAVWVLGTLGRILLEWYWDSLYSTTADHSCNRNYGVRKSWKLFLGQAIVYPIFGMEALEAQVR